MKYLILILAILFLGSCMTSQIKMEPGPDLLAITYPLEGSIVVKDGVKYYVIDHLELQRLLRELREDSIVILGQEDEDKLEDDIVNVD